MTMLAHSRWIAIAERVGPVGPVGLARWKPLAAAPWSIPDAMLDVERGRLLSAQRRDADGVIRLYVTERRSPHARPAGALAARLHAERQPFCQVPA